MEAGSLLTVLPTLKLGCFLTYEDILTVLRLLMARATLKLGCFLIYEDNLTMLRIFLWQAQCLIIRTSVHSAVHILPPVEPVSRFGVSPFQSEEAATRRRYPPGERRETMQARSRRGQSTSSPAPSRAGLKAATVSLQRPIPVFFRSTINAMRGSSGERDDDDLVRVIDVQTMRYRC